MANHSRILIYGKNEMQFKTKGFGVGVKLK